MPHQKKSHSFLGFPEDRSGLGACKAGHVTHSRDLFCSTPHLETQLYLPLAPLFDVEPKGAWNIKVLHLVLRIAFVVNWIDGPEFNF